MNKQGLIAEVSRSTGLPASDTSRVVEALLKKIGESLVSGDEVHLVGFGKFSVNKRKPSSGRNPRTGEPISIDSVARPKFRAGKTLRELVN